MGARVALIAPAGPLRGPEDVAAAEANTRVFGWEPVVGESVLACDGYLAGSDAQRLADINWALNDATIDALWCIRGGYGITRILDEIDYDALIRHPKPVIGYSDITALHCAIGQRCHLVSYHAPTARATMTPFTRNSFERALIFGEDPCGTAHSARTVRAGTAQGRVMGGNVALLSALCGTPYAPDLRDAILVLEDINEPVYRIDRMLHQLAMTGALAEVRGIAFGQCTGCEDGDDGAREGRTLDRVLREVADRFTIPCVAGFPFGHVDDQWSLPLGYLATLDADGLALHIHM
jgi:muramoyltetrapeptide carboxypeptidase